MITSTIDLKDKTVNSLMIPVQQIFSLNEDCSFDKETMSKIYTHNYSYLVVYKDQRDNITGTIRTKQLIDMESKGKKVSELPNVKPALYVQSDTSLLDMLMIFKQRKTKIAFVVELPSQVRKEQKELQLRSV